MTLVAAYRPEGVPILIGDFLITGSGHESTRKKIYKVGPNFVVGWSGPAFVAASILKALFAAFEDKVVSLAEVDEFFTNRPGDELSDQPFLIVGWVIGEQPYCFLWNILIPTRLFYEPYYVIGSGSQKFQELITTKSLGGSLETRRTSVDQAVFSALTIAAELYSDENLERMNRREGFGHGYELLYFDGKEFNYIENIAFFGMDILWNLDDEFSGNSQPYGYWYRYHSLSNAAFLQLLNIRTGAMTLEVITPVFKGSSMYVKVGQNDKCVVLGLINYGGWDKDFSSMEHAVMAAADGTVRVYEKGIAVGPFGKTYLPNDVLGIAVEQINSAPTARYYLNSECIYESSKRTNFPLRGAISLREDGASVSESKITGKWLRSGFAAGN